MIAPFSASSKASPWRIKINKKGTKLYINYYNIIKSKVYINSSFSINEIILNIFSQIFYLYLDKRTYKKENEKQTIEYVILNLIITKDRDKSFYFKQNFLYLEYQGYKLSDVTKSEFYEIGIKR